MRRMYRYHEAKELHALGSSRGFSLISKPLPWLYSLQIYLLGDVVMGCGLWNGSYSETAYARHHLNDMQRIDHDQGSHVGMMSFLEHLGHSSFMCTVTQFTLEYFTWVVYFQH